MTKLILLAALSLLSLTACQSRFGQLGRIFPDGASVTMIKPQLTASGTALSISAEEISWRGTNGFAYSSSDLPTNATVIVTTPAQSQFQPIPSRAQRAHK